MDQKSVAQLDNAFKVLEKEGNKVSRDGALPAGKNAEAGHDIPSFNAGMRYAMSRMKTSIKQIQEGKYAVVDFPRQGQHALPADGAPKAATPAKAKKAPAPAKKAAPTKAKAKRAPAKKTASKPDATVTDISSAKAKAKAKRVRKTASKAVAVDG